MKVFFGTLKVFISQMSYDIYDRVYDFFAVLWENLYGVFKRLVVVIGVIVTLLFDAWIFWMLYNWVEHPLMIVSSGVGIGLLVLLQVGAWIGRVYYYECFLEKWSRASHTYQRNKEIS